MAMSRRSSVVSENISVNKYPSSSGCPTPSPRVIDTDVATTDLSDDEAVSADSLQVLQGVIAYVEVRTNNDNRSHAISKALCQLGAEVVTKFTDDVTHVIYKEGKKRTRDKAVKKKVHLVSVLWVDSCRKNKEHVSEKLFPAILPEASSSPIPFGRLKKMKSMQPTDFAEDLVGSAERCQKRRKRVATMRRFQLSEETPDFTPPASHILVQETQPRSGPESANRACSSRWTTPMTLTIPDTPPSMREKLQELKQAKENGTYFSPLARPGDMEPLIRKLFANECISNEDMMAFEEEDPLPPKKPSSSEEEKISSSNNTKGKKKLLTEPVKPSSFLIEPTHCSGEERPGLLPSEKRPVSKGKKRTSADDTISGLVRSTVKAPGSGPVVKGKERTLAKDVESTPVHGPGQFIDGSHSGPVRRPRKSQVIQEPGSGPSKRGQKRKAEVNCDQDELEKHTLKKTKCNDVQVEAKVGNGNGVVRRRSLRGGGRVIPVITQTGSDVHTSDVSRTDATMSTLCETDRSGVLGASMSAVFDSTAMLGFAPPRQSIDEFSICNPRKKGQKDTTSRLTSIQEHNANGSKSKPKSKQTKACALLPPSSSASGDDEATETSINDVSKEDNTAKPSRIKLRRANSLEKSALLSNTSLTNRHRPSLVMTSLHTHEQETIISVVKQLGCFLMQDNVTETTTHVVYGDPRRTLNVLAAIARGCWLLSKEWVFKSVEAGHWLDEEEFECCDKFPQAKIARANRQTQGEEYRQILFDECGQIFVSHKCVPPRGSLVNLLTLCGGQITHSASRCSVHIGPEGLSGKTSVKPVWALDCIMEQKLLPYEDYQTVPTKNRDSSPEF